MMTEQQASPRPAADRKPPPRGPEGEVALRGLVDAHFDFVWRWLRRMGVAEHEADDGAQRVFLIAAERIADIRPGAEQAFLRAVARRVASSIRRATQRRGEELSDDLGDVPWQAGLAVDEALARRDALALLDALLEGMDDDLREVFVLAEIEEMTAPAIAALLEIAEGTVRSRLRRAREDFETRAARVRARHQREGAA